jgi:hypothetical protein
MAENSEDSEEQSSCSILDEDSDKDKADTKPGQIRIKKPEHYSKTKLAEILGNHTKANINMLRTCLKNIDVSLSGYKAVYRIR